jgi:DNA-binding NtrC family response regulator/tetratricopeptide (TPR) repeat protein
MITPIARAEAIRSLLTVESIESERTSIGEAVLDCCTSLIEAGHCQVAVELARESLATPMREDDVLGVRLSTVLARALCTSARGAEALELIDSVLESRGKVLGASPTLRLGLNVYNGAALWQLNRAPEATRLLSSVRNELLQQPDSELLGWCAYHLSAAHIVAGVRALAHRYVLEALVSARRAGAVYLEAVSLRSLGLLETANARWAVAGDWLTASEKISTSSGFATLRSTALRALAVLDWKRGTVPDALARASECIDVLSTTGHATHAAIGHLLRGAVLCHAGDFAASRTAIEIAQGNGPDQQTRPALLATEFLGDVHLEQGQAAEALKLYDDVLPRALALVPKGDIVAELRRRRAECYYLLGRFSEAHAEALAGLDHCRDLGDRYEEAATYRVLALSTAAIGNPSDAKKWFDQGFAYYDDIETPYEWGKLWMAYGDWLRGPHAAEYRDEQAALEAYVAAADHFERMGAMARLGEAQARIVEVRPAPPKAALTGSGAPAPSARKQRPARKPRAQVELERRGVWAEQEFGFITRNRGVLDLLEEVAKLARSDTPILVLGESGTGKELVANGVHRLSKRGGQFMAINCSAIPREMIESELFGHVAGSFTGATRDKPGIFETCDGGTVFLDEVGEMSLDLQSRLLRLLERSEARRVGSNRDYRVDTRVVAATNRERVALERGEGFRSDLYYRLAHAVIVLPPLRRRTDDLQVLIDRFLAEFAEAERRVGVELSDPARERLLRHSWPGNVRQLRAVLRRAVLLSSPGKPVEVADLQLDDFSAPVTLGEEMEAAEKARIVEALARSRGSRTEAARSLGMPRTTLINKMQRHGLM